MIRISIPSVFFTGCFVVALLSCLICATCLSAQETIVINYSEDLAPMSYYENGEMKGILIEVLDNILASRMGMQVKHNGYPWKRAQLMIKTGKADAFCTIPDARRTEYAYFTKNPVIVCRPAIFTGSNNPRIDEIRGINDMNALRSFRQTDYLGDTWVRKTFPKDILDNMHWVGSLKTVFKMLAINRYDIYIGIDYTGCYTIREIGLIGEIYIQPITIGRPVQYYFGLRKTYPNAEIIRDNVDLAVRGAVMEGSIARIVEKYTF